MCSFKQTNKQKPMQTCLTNIWIKLNRPEDQLISDYHSWTRNVDAKFIASLGKQSKQRRYDKIQERYQQLPLPLPLLSVAPEQKYETWDQSLFPVLNCTALCDPEGVSPRGIWTFVRLHLGGGKSQVHSHMPAQSSSFFSCQRCHLVTHSWKCELAHLGNVVLEVSWMFCQWCFDLWWVFHTCNWWACIWEPHSQNHKVERMWQHSANMSCLSPSLIAYIAVNIVYVAVSSWLIPV